MTEFAMLVTCQSGKHSLFGDGYPCSAKERSRLAMASRHVVFELHAIGELIYNGLDIDMEIFKS